MQCYIDFTVTLFWFWLAAWHTIS